MKPKKEFRPQTLRSLLSVLFIIILIAGGAGFYFGLEKVREYAQQVDNRIADANASAKQIEELQVLKSQLSQSNSLVEKANQLFSTPASYQAQVLSDLKTYADLAGLSLANTSFGNPAESGVHTITISLKQPVTYTGLITFLNNVESNLPKMQVSSISLGQPVSGGANSVKTGDIKIDISVR